MIEGDDDRRRVDVLVRVRESADSVTRVRDLRTAVRALREIVEGVEDGELSLEDDDLLARAVTIRDVVERHVDERGTPMSDAWESLEHAVAMWRERSGNAMFELRSALRVLEDLPGGRP